MAKRSPKLFLAALCAVCLLHDWHGAAAQQTPPPKKTWELGIDEAIRIALTNNLDIRISRLNPEMDQYALTGLRGAYEPSLTYSMTHDYNSFPNGGFTQAGLYYNSEVQQINSYTPGLSGSLPSGLTYNLTAPFSEQNVRGSQDLYNTQPGITMNQPLLKNFWIDNTRYQILLGRQTLKNDQLALRLQIMTVIYNVKAAYYNLIYARENVKVEQAAVDLAEETFHEDEQKVRVGALAPLDEKQAESQAASAHSDLLTAQVNLAAQENAMKTLLTVPMGQWGEMSPLPTEPLVAVPAHPLVLECWRAGLEKRPDMLQAKLSIEKQHITLKYNFNQLFPEIDLTGSYGRNATEPTAGGALDSIRRGTYPSYSYGVAMTIPLGNTGPRNTYKSARAALEQLLLQAKKVEQSIVAAIDNDVKTVDADLLKVDITRKARLYAEEALQAEQTRLEHGKSTSFIVLQLQNNLTSSRSAEIRALADYNIALEQLALDEGATLEENHISLQVR